MELLETPAGFVVNFDPPHGSSERCFAYFKFTDLKRSAYDMKVVRRVRRPLAGPDREYRHVLQSVGHDLDAIHAVSILIDELPESLIISYEYDDPGRGYSLRKRMALAGPKDRERLLRDAHRRHRRIQPRPTPHWEPAREPAALR